MVRDAPSYCQSARTAGQQGEKWGGTEAILLKNRVNAAEIVEAPYLGVCLRDQAHILCIVCDFRLRDFRF